MTRHGLVLIPLPLACPTEEHGHFTEVLFTITQGFSANLYFLHTLVLYYGCNSRFQNSLAPHVCVCVCVSCGSSCLVLVPGVVRVGGENEYNGEDFTRIWMFIGSLHLVLCMARFHIRVRWK